MASELSSSNDISSFYKNGWWIRLWVQNPVDVCNLPIKINKGLGEAACVTNRESNAVYV